MGSCGLEEYRIESIETSSAYSQSTAHFSYNTYL
jgi:hypothetical protein